MRLLDDFPQYKTTIYLYAIACIIALILTPMTVSAQALSDETETQETKESSMELEINAEPEDTQEVTNEDSEVEVSPAVEKESEAASPVPEATSSTEQQSTKERVPTREKHQPLVKVKAETKVPLTKEQTESIVPISSANQQREPLPGSLRSGPVLAVTNQASSEERILSPAESVGIPPSTSAVREYRNNFTRHGASEAVAAQQSSSNGSAVNYSNTSLSERETRLGYVVSIGLLLSGVLMVVATHATRSAKLNSFPVNHRKSNQQTI